MTKTKCLMALTPGGNVIKLFSFVADDCLHLAISFLSSLTFAGNTRSLPKKESSEGALIGLALDLPSNSKT
jgi:hypothetical protein